MTENYQELAKKKLLMAHEYIAYEEGVNDNDYVPLQPEEVFIVWFAKTLQNWKALLSTTRMDEMYYEVTYNGDKGETYVDAYKKSHNVLLRD